MNMPFVLRSTYDALESRFNLAVAFRQEMERRAEESYQEVAKLMIARDAYRDVRDAYRDDVNQRDATIATLRGYVATRDEMILAHESNVRMYTESIRIREASESRLADRVVELESQLAAATKSPAKPRRSKLTEAIREQATLPDGSVDPRLLNHFRARATTLRRQGKKEVDIIEAIGVWSTTERGESAITVDAIVANMSADAIP